MATQFDFKSSHPIELEKEISLPGDVFFDPDNLSLHGFYSDQLSAYRAKNAWTDTLENCFLLDRTHDVEMKISSDLTRGEFTLNCQFISACARYAFFRLTNHQAPEAQYLIETAHIPDSESHHADLISAPDLKPIRDAKLGKVRGGCSQAGTRGIVNRLAGALRNIIR